MTVVPDSQYVIQDKVGYAQLTMSKTKEDATYQEDSLMNTIETIKYTLQKQRNFIDSRERISGSILQNPCRKKRSLSLSKEIAPRSIA